MKKILLLLLLFCQFSNCISQSSSKATYKLLQGNWYKSKDDNVEFSIQGNTYKYFEDDKKYIIRVKTNIIEVCFEDGTPISKYKILKLTNRTLWGKAEDGTILKFIKQK